LRNLRHDQDLAVVAWGTVAASVALLAWSLAQSRDANWAWLIPAGVIVGLVVPASLRFAVVRNHAGTISSALTLVIGASLALFGVSADDVPFAGNLFVALIGPAFAVWQCQLAISRDAAAAAAALERQREEAAERRHREVLAAIANMDTRRRWRCWVGR
jgi:hypothetical protein